MSKEDSSIANPLLATLSTTPSVELAYTHTQASMAMDPRTSTSVATRRLPCIMLLQCELQYGHSCAAPPQRAQCQLRGLAPRSRLGTAYAPQAAGRRATTHRPGSLLPCMSLHVRQRMAATTALSCQAAKRHTPFIRDTNSVVLPMGSRRPSALFPGLPETDNEFSFSTPSREPTVSQGTSDAQPRPLWALRMRYANLCPRGSGGAMAPSQR